MDKDTSAPITAYSSDILMAGALLFTVGMALGVIVGITWVI